MKNACEKFSGFLVGLCCLAACARLATAATQEVRILAIVNNEIITSYELDQAMLSFRDQLLAIEDPHKRTATEKKGRMDVLEDLIRNRLLDQEFETLGIRANDAEVNEEWRRIIERTGVTEERFREELKRQGVSEERYRKNLSEHLKLLKLISRKIRPKVAIDEQDIRSEYDRNPVEYSHGERIHLIEVDVPRSLAKELTNLRTKMVRGFESREEFLRRFPGAKVLDLGTLDPRDLSPDLRKAIETLKKGEVTPALSSPSGFRIYRVIDRTAGEPLPYEEARERIRLKLFEREIERELDLYMANLRRTAHVEVKM